MKKAFTLLFTVLFAFSVTISAAAISPRATNGVEATIQPNDIIKIGTPLSMAAGELITINCTYSPRTADLDFGLLTPRGTFVFIAGENGTCNQTIQVSQTGNYYFTVRNNSSEAVEVLGYVYY